MPPVVEVVVSVASTITATAAVKSWSYLKNMHDNLTTRINANEDRSKQNKEIQRGDPDMGDPLVERVDRLESQGGD